MKQNDVTRKLAFAGLLTAVAVAGSLLSVPVAGSKCAPVQHMVNILAAVFLGPWWGLGIAFSASLLRNILGLGSLMAFPGSMAGALCCGLVYAGTSLLGGLLAWPVAKFLMGAEPAGLLIYVVPFFVSTAAGSILAYGLITGLGRGRLLEQFMKARS